MYINVLFIFNRESFSESGSHSVWIFKLSDFSDFDELKMNYNVWIRRRVIENFLWLFIDIPLAVLAFICMVSVYKGVDLWHLIIDPRDTSRDPLENKLRRNDHEMVLRRQIIINFLLLVFDIVIMSWQLVFIIITLYRVPAMFGHFKYSWGLSMIHCHL